MEANLRNKGLQSIYGGLQMLNESKAENMSALAEISILISNSELRERHQIGDEVTHLLEALHFLLKDLTPEAVKLVTDHINNIHYGSEQQGSNIDYKSKYEETIEKLSAANGRLLEYIDQSQN